MTLPCGWKPERGTWHDAVKRAERKRVWSRRRAVAFCVLAIAAVLALYFYGAREAWRHRPGQRPNSSNGAVRVVVALPSCSDAENHPQGGEFLVTTIQSEGGAQGKEHETPFRKPGGGRANPRGWFLARPPIHGARAW